MNFAELADPEFWRQLLSSDFNRGYAAAIGLVFALLLLLLVLKVIFKLLFRTRRCGAIPVRGGSTITVSTCLPLFLPHAATSAVNESADGAFCRERARHCFSRSTA